MKGNIKQVNGIWKESVRKDLWSYKERDSTCIIKTNDEWDELIIKHQNIINHKKTQRLSWSGHLHGMSEEGMVLKYTSGDRWQYDQKADERTDGKVT